jgi:xanthine dehydrogenase accessory factor
MSSDLYAVCAKLEEGRRPYVLATVVRVMGSASAKPGSKAVIDEHGRNIHGWVGGGCAEGLVRDESMQALAERQSRVVRVDLDDEVLGVGMPCGGNMEVYLEPHFPPRRLWIAGHNRLARHLSALAGALGYSVAVRAPEARPEHFPGAESVQAGEWEAFDPEPGGVVIIAGDHQHHAAVLRRVLDVEPAYVALVASREVSRGIFSALRRERYPERALAAVRTPAGLDLRARKLEEISFSIIAELLAWERRKSGMSMRLLGETYLGSAASAPDLTSTPALTAVQTSSELPPPLVIVGHGRIAEELARLATLAGWPVTVNAPQASREDFPSAACLITGDLDYAALNVTPESHIVIATLHKGDHLSMQKALEGKAAYIGLIASRKRTGLILDFLRGKGFGPDALERVYAPAGLDFGAMNPTEIAFSILCEMVAVCRGGTGRPLAELETAMASGGEDACRQLFQ